MGNYTQAQINARNRWAKKKYDRLAFLVPCGAAEQLRQLASEAGVSLNRYIAEAVEARSGLRLTLNGEFKTKPNSEMKN